MGVDKNDRGVRGQPPIIRVDSPGWLKTIVRLLTDEAGKGEGITDVVRRLLSENKTYAEIVSQLDEVRVLIGEEVFPGETPVEVVRRLIRNGGGQRSMNNPHDPSATLCEPLFDALARMERKKRDEIRYLCERLARGVDDGSTDGVVEAAILNDLVAELRVLESAPTILRSADACGRRPPR